jgi:hypothetical protein
MTSVAEKILAHAEALPEGAGFCAKELLHLGERAAVDQALARLERSGSISRISRGLYLKLKRGKYGPRTPQPDTVVAALAHATGETIAEHGAAAANALGLTTQHPLKPIYLTSGPSRELRIGGQMVELRHARDWELILPKEAAGAALRALAWAGREHVASLVEGLRRTLPQVERERLMSVRARLPTWLAQEVSRLAS